MSQENSSVENTALLEQTSEDVLSQQSGTSSNTTELHCTLSQHSGINTSRNDLTKEESPKKTDGCETSRAPTTVTVCLLKSVSKYTVPIIKDCVVVEAVLDSATEVTIISDNVYDSLKQPPKKLYDVRLDTAGRQLSMHGFVAGPVKLKIVRSTYDGPVYVAPIEQDMLFGVYIMGKGSAVIDMGRGVFAFKGHEIKMNNGVPKGGGTQKSLVYLLQDES